LQREGVRTMPVGYEDELSPPEENLAPLSVLVGKTRLVADVQANKLIAFGPPEDQAKITRLLDQLDRKPPQVYLSTIIGQLNLGDGFEFGIDYLVNLDGEGVGDLAGAFLTGDVLQKAISDLRDPTVNDGVPPGRGLNVYGEITDGFAVFLRALEATDRFKVLSRPAIYAANNKKAVITSGRRIPVPTSSITDLANTSSVRTNITYQDVVLKLEVIPLINSNREVSLTIAQINDTVSGEQRVGENIVPIIGTERLVTTVTVANRSTIVLGGLITENEEHSTTGIPVLCRIPILGHAFKSTTTKKSRKELLIFIQPVVVEDHAEAEAASLSEDFRTQVGSDSAIAFPPPDPVSEPAARTAPRRPGAGNSSATPGPSSDLLSPVPTKPSRRLPEER
jgi:type II secretory pathway component GspD/PulD (secretin)